VTPSDIPHQPAPGRDDGDEVDPTGIRNLLRSLPDPGPMPEDLVRRIETRLAVELAHRAPSHPFTDEPVEAGGGRVVDLGSERARRRPGRTVLLLGVAAGGLLLTTVVVNDLFGSGMVGGADTAAYAPPSEDAARDDAAGGAADEQAEADAGQAAGGGSAAEDSAGGDEAAGEGATGGAEVVVLEDLGEVDETGFGDRVRLLGEADLDGSAPSTLSAAQAKSCWAIVADADDWTSRYAAPARLDDDAVVMLWGHQRDGDGHAWLMPDECMVNPATPPLADAPLSP
jgi:hypothetical protein